MTFGSLCAKSGVLYVGRHDRTGHVRPYDFDGRPLADGFAVHGPCGGACSIGGLEVDPDHQVWIADGSSDRVRCFSLFGRESAGLSCLERAREDSRGALRALVDVALEGSDDDPRLVVASGGWRRHAVQVFGLDGRCLESLRPEGNPLGHFRGVSRVVARGRWLYVCESGAGRVQVFRDREFHFALRVPVSTGRFEPVALAALADGRLVVATSGSNSALLLLDAGGRLLRVLAEGGGDEGQVLEPGDVVVEDAERDLRTRIALIDRDAERVQVFTLEGRCHGAVDVLPGRAL